MPITERTLRKWRKKALIINKEAEDSHGCELTDFEIIAMCERILRMSSELLDQHLLRKVK